MEPPSGFDSTQGKTQEFLGSNWCRIVRTTRDRQCGSLRPEDCDKVEGICPSKAKAGMPATFQCMLPYWGSTQSCKASSHLSESFIEHLANCTNQVVPPHDHRCRQKRSYGYTYDDTRDTVLSPIASSEDIACMMGFDFERIHDHVLKANPSR